MTKPVIIIHGGAGHFEGGDIAAEAYHEALADIVEDAYGVLCRCDAETAVLHGVALLESNPIFNAGTGSRIQKDGQIRMSAAIMKASTNRFSGVINIKNVEHPIQVAHLLSEEKYTVLGGNEATEYARSHQLPYYNPMTEHRLKEYKNELLGETGTVGVVALDSRGHICVGTSTGGVGYETPGRIGDSATVAGTYASSFAGVSCTGKGEHIINQAVAARIVTRVEDGMPLQDAVDKMMEEANRYKYRFGLIALNKSGDVVVGQSRDIEVLYATFQHDQLKTFFSARNT